MEQRIKFKEHLESKLIPFWERLEDRENGGFYGYMDTELRVVPESEKGCILNSRILWFFSNAYMTLHKNELRNYAEHAYFFLRDKCLDAKNGGVFWSVDHKGNPLDMTKHTYNQAFAIYALAGYYDAFEEESAYELACSLMNIIETKCRDKYGYKEAQSVNFETVPNDKLSENGVMADRTMNTLLHVFEAYTELLRVSKKHDKKEVSALVSVKLKEMFDLVANKIYNPVKKRQEVFFDNDMNSLIDLHSYGHDIETAWLLDRGLEVLGDKEYSSLIAPITKALEDTIISTAYDAHSLANECENGVVNEWRIWWVQAEAVVGFYNAYMKRTASGEAEAEKFKRASEDIWGFIQTRLTDNRPGGEWFWRVDKNGTPDLEKPIVEPWKCPYHNGRMCMEMMKRIK